MEKKQKKEYAKIIILSILILLFGISITFSSQISSVIKKVLYKTDIKASADDLVVHFISVGQGDAIALRFPNEKVMLIDSGPKVSQNMLVEYVKDNVLKSNNKLVIDYLLLTHSDIDHSGGVCAIFAEFEVENFYRPNIASKSEKAGDFAMQSTLDEYDEVIKSANKEKDLQINVINQQLEFYIGDVYVQVFPPVKVYSSTNEMSPIIKVSYLDKSFLFTGDIQGDSESDMIEQYGEELNADVLKVAHHGSSSSTSDEFVSKVTPRYAVICVGENTYGHPHLTTITTLESFDAEILTTKENDVVFVCGKEVFGILDTYKTHSHEFVDWWVIVLIVEILLAFNLTKSIVLVIKINKEDYTI